MFDERYERMIKSVADVYTAIVPYPHLVMEPRVYLGKPSGCPLVLFSFGRQPSREYTYCIQRVKRVATRFYLCYLVVRSGEDLGYAAPCFKLVRRVLSVDEIYAYLKASDVHLLPKWGHPGVVVSSTLAQTLYAGVSVVVPDTRYFETIPSFEDSGPLVKYRLGDVRDLVDKLLYLLGDESARRDLSTRTVRYVWVRHAALIARQILGYLVK